MAETYIRCDHQGLEALYPRIKAFLQHDIVEYDMFGRKARAYRTPDAPSVWIRDLSDMMRGFKYWEADMQSAIDHFACTQSAQGWIFDYFTMTPEKIPCERENWAKYVRVPVEADVEYRFVKAIHQAWQATGDDLWMRDLLPNMERALNYVLTDQWRWDRSTELVKRPYTIDTWDFDYTGGRHPWLNFQIDNHSYWGIMHGDNSGYFEAFRLMSLMHAQAGHRRRARYWETFANAFRLRANRICFNGRFYTHHVPLVPVRIEGVEEAQQLSLSNPMAINRGLAGHPMAVEIIQEYQKRGASGGAFAEWFSIDPPMPDGVFGDAKLVGGAYCNGGIMPLVGAELARAAFEHGFEAYAVRQLLIYEELTRNNETYLWYFPDGRHATVETSTSPEASPTDGWGSSSMLYALIEGLAGVQDRHKLYQRVRLSPRWLAAGVNKAELCTTYGASGAWFEYLYRHDPGRAIELKLNGRARVELHLLLPQGATAVTMKLNGRNTRHATTYVEQSPYADARFELKERAELEVRYRVG